MQNDSHIPTDNYLWEQLIRGDKNAFSILFGRYYNDLYAYSVKLTREGDLSHDIIQELFMNLWSTRNKLKPVDVLKPFLLRCVRNLIIDYRRKALSIEKKHQGLEVEEIIFSPEDFRISTEEMETQTEKVLTLLNTLPDRVRESIYLRFFIGLNYFEIASVMEVSVQSARNSVHRGIQQMKELYTIFIAIVPYCV